MHSNQGEPQSLGGTGSDSGSGSGTKTGMGIDVRKAYALVIGVGEYERREWSIPVASRDAEALAEVLGNPTRCGYPAASNIWLLRDDEATRANILDGLAWLEGRARKEPDATVLVYYSGHGWTENPEGADRSFLIVQDTDPDRLEETALPATAFLEGLRKIHSRRLLVLLDTCHAANMAEAKDGENGEASIVSVAAPSGYRDHGLSNTVAGGLGVLSEDLAKVHGQESWGRTLLASCDGDQKSWFAPGARLSFFTQHLIEAFEGRGTPADEGLVRVSHVMGWVSQRVEASAAALGRRQTPITKMEGMDFAVARIDSPGGGLPSHRVAEDSADDSIERAPEGRSAVIQLDRAEAGNARLEGFVGDSHERDRAEIGVKESKIVDNLDVTAFRSRPAGQ